MISVRFLQRIAAYPQDVQEMLQQQVTETVMARILRVMHGATADGAPPPSPAILVDTLLARLVTSKRFIANARKLTKAIGSRTDSTVLDEMTGWFLGPLADRDAPYLYKIAEAAEAEAQPETRAVLMDLMAVIEEFNAFNADLARDKTLPAMIAGQITSAGTSGNMSRVNALMRALGQTILFTAGNGNTPPAADNQDLRVQLLRHLLGTGPKTELSGLDRLALQAMEQAQSKGRARSLRPASMPTIRLTGNAGTEDTQFWDNAGQAGGTGPILQISARLRMSPIALAFLSCAVLPAGGGIRIMGVDLKIEGERWESEIVGYRGLDSGKSEGGQFSDTGTLGANAWEMTLAARMHTADDNAGGHKDLNTCYAIILRLDEDADLSRYTNIESCAVFDSVDQLMSALAEANARVRRKPLIFIGRRSPRVADYIISTVPAYWSYGGNHLISCTELTYDGITGKFSVRLPARHRLGRLTAVETSVMPVACALALGAEFHRALDTGVIVLGDELAVSRQGTVVVDDDVPTRLQRNLNADRLTAAERERVFLTGTTDHAWLARQDSSRNWSIERLMSQGLEHHHTLRSQLGEFVANPTVSVADAIFGRMEVRSAASLGLMAEIDAFAITLSENPAILLELPVEHVLKFLELSRQTPGADMIARNLAAYADQICRKSIDLIVPLFEFLACCLQRYTLLSALSFAATTNTGQAKYIFRIAESIRRYGDEATMVLFLGRIHREMPQLLMERALLRCFQRLLDSSQAAVIHAIVGPEVLKGIEDTVDFRDRFRNAVVDGDRTEVLRLVSNPAVVRQVDFTRWMDGLRSLSNELRDLALDPFIIPGIEGLHRRKLAAVTFADTTTLEEFRRNGFLNAALDINAIAHNALGDNVPLNAMIAQKFEGSGIPPVTVEGTTVAEVFARAATSLKTGRPGSQDGPLVSVIVSAFNPDLDLLRLSVQSVLDQSSANVEIFVVDDASEVESSAAMERMFMGIPQVRYLRIATNSGPYVGRNLAISQAKGDFVAIQDADDWSHPDRFAAQIAAFQATPELRLVTTPHIRIDRAGRVQMEANFTIFGDGPMTSMFRRAVFDEVGTFANVRSRGDVEMRERIHAYYGQQALEEIEAPAMLCFADSATLSQKTKTEAAEYLQLFRTNISRRRSFANLRRDNIRIGQDHHIIVPLALRPVQEGDAQ